MTLGSLALCRGPRGRCNCFDTRAPPPGPPASPLTSSNMLPVLCTVNTATQRPNVDRRRKAGHLLASRCQGCMRIAHANIHKNQLRTQPRALNANGKRCRRRRRSGQHDGSREERHASGPHPLLQSSMVGVKRLPGAFSQRLSTGCWDIAAWVRFDQHTRPLAFDGWPPAPHAHSSLCGDMPCHLFAANDIILTRAPDMHPYAPACRFSKWPLDVTQRERPGGGEAHNMHTQASQGSVGGPEPPRLSVGRGDPAQAGHSRPAPAGPRAHMAALRGPPRRRAAL